MADKMLSAEALRDFVAQVLARLDVPEAEAGIVARWMVEADLLGHETHGLFRLRQYANRLRDGGIDPKGRPVVLRETAATALVDGGNGLGHLAMTMATDLAMQKARQTGIGWVGVRGGNHAGPAALYVRPQAKANMIGLCAAVGSANHVAPWGGMDLLLGTNPIAVGAPSGGADPFVLDMATTVAAMGKIKTLIQRGAPMPEGWLVGRDGQPLTDPTRHKEGLMLPIGGPKGFGLSVAIGLLAGVLNGAAFGADVVDFTTDTTSPTNTGQFVAAIDIAAFTDPATFAATTSRVFEEFRSATPLPGHDPIRLPGEGREAQRAAREAEGIALHPSLLAALTELAAEFGLAPPAE